jgi:hypothetical protein
MPIDCHPLYKKAILPHGLWPQGNLADGAFEHVAALARLRPWAISI